MRKYKILLGGIIALLALTVFSVSTLYVDADDVQNRFVQTMNGLYIRKYVSLGNIPQDEQSVYKNVEDDKQEQPTHVVSVAPSSDDPDLWDSYIDSLDIGDTRKMMYRLKC